MNKKFGEIIILKIKNKTISGVKLFRVGNEMLSIFLF